MNTNKRMNKFLAVAKWLALRVIVVDEPLENRQIIFWAFFGVVYFAVICFMIWIILFDRSVIGEYYRFAVANKDNLVGMGMLVVCAIGAGYAAHIFRQANQRFYGLTEILFALVYTIATLQQADLLTPLPAITAIGGAIYLVRDGFSNMQPEKARHPLRGKI